MDGPRAGSHREGSWKALATRARVRRIRVAMALTLRKLQAHVVQRHPNSPVVPPNHGDKTSAHIQRTSTPNALNALNALNAVEAELAALTQWHQDGALSDDELRSQTIELLASKLPMLHAGRCIAADPPSRASPPTSSWACSRRARSTRAPRLPR